MLTRFQHTKRIQYTLTFSKKNTSEFPRQSRDVNSFSPDAGLRPHEFGCPSQEIDAEKDADGRGSATRPRDVIPTEGVSSWVLGFHGTWMFLIVETSLER